MAYRGEDIKIVVKGDAIYDLDKCDFKVLLYPDRHPNEATVISKEEMTREGSNYYSGEISAEASKALPIGLYTIEVLVFDGEDDRTIFLERSVLPIYDSGSKNI